MKTPWEMCPKPHGWDATKTRYKLYSQDKNHHPPQLLEVKRVKEGDSHTDVLMAAADLMAGLGGGAASGRVDSGSLTVRMGPLLSFEPLTDIRQPDEDLSFLCSKKIPQEM